MSLFEKNVQNYLLIITFCWVLYWHIYLCIVYLSQTHFPELCCWVAQCLFVEPEEQFHFYLESVCTDGVEREKWGKCGPSSDTPKRKKPCFAFELFWICINWIFPSLLIEMIPQQPLFACFWVCLVFAPTSQKELLQIHLHLTLFLLWWMGRPWAFFTSLGRCHRWKRFPSACPTASPYTW